MTGWEDLIANTLPGVFGADILLGLGLLLVVNIFIAVQRVPFLVAILANGMIIILIFGPVATSKIAVGGLGANLFVFFGVLFLAAIVLYAGLKATVLREN